MPAADSSTSRPNHSNTSRQARHRQQQQQRDSAEASAPMQACAYHQHRHSLAHQSQTRHASSAHSASVPHSTKPRDSATHTKTADLGSSHHPHGVRQVGQQQQPRQVSSSHASAARQPDSTADLNNAHTASASGIVPSLSSRGNHSQHLNAVGQNTCTRAAGYDLCVIKRPYRS